jgi:hypothetical protein
MTHIAKYLFFIIILAAASYAAATFDIASLIGAKASKSPIGQKGFRKPYISRKPTSQLGGFETQAVVDYSPIRNLTAAAADDVITVWQLPEVTPLQEIDSGVGFQAAALRFIPATSLVAAGGIKDDFTGAIRFFDAATGAQRMQIDEAEAIQFLDPHPGGRFILATADTYIKVLDMKDGNTVAVLQKNSPTARGYYYGNGQYILQSDSLSLFDLNKRITTGILDSEPPLLFKKGLDGTTFSWLSSEGVSVVTAAQGIKHFFPLVTKGVTAFDIESNGTWGLFLRDTQKLEVTELATGKAVKTLLLATPATEVTISPDGASAFIVYASGSIAVHDIGHRNKVKKLQYQLTKLFGTVADKLGQVAKPLPK